MFTNSASFADRVSVAVVCETMFFPSCRWSLSTGATNRFISLPLFSFSSTRPCMQQGLSSPELICGLVETLHRLLHLHVCQHICFCQPVVRVLHLGQVVHIALESLVDVPELVVGLFLLVLPTIYTATGTSKQFAHFQQP